MTTMSNTTTQAAPATFDPTATGGAVRVTPYLNFDGTTREAMTFYHHCLGGELSVMTFGDGGWGDTPEERARVVHARLENGQVVLMASDTTVYGAPFQPGNNVHLNVECASVEALESLYVALGEGGQAAMPPHDAFWGARFGMLIDRFGVQWMLNHERPPA